MRERVISIGQANPLIGIISQPEAAEVTNPSIAVILLNSGVIHRVGSCRLSVTLARAIAEQAGVLTLRFDFSGIGDSGARRNALIAYESAVEEVQEVMDYLAREKQIKEFILYGLCSGAYASYRTALRDPRVVGIAQLDGYCYMSWKSYFHHYLPRLFSMARWTSITKRALGLKTTSAADAGKDELRFFEVPTFGNFPPKAEVVAGLDKLVRRGIKLFSVFARSDHYNYEGQFRDCFSSIPFSKSDKVLYLPAASHIVAEPDDQKLVVAGIADWVKTLAKSG
jgi:pimeloyl-ACP methyl ester carboxylesterase